MHFANFEGFWGFSVLSIILVDLLGNTCLLVQVQKVMVCAFCDWWILVRFFVLHFKVCCFVIILFWAIIDWLSLLRRFSWSFLFLSLARIMQCLPPSFNKKSTHHRDLRCYSWTVKSLAKLGEHVTMWFALTPPSLKWLMEQKNPKSLQSLQYAQGDTTNFAVICQPIRTPAQI